MATYCPCAESDESQGYGECPRGIHVMCDERCGALEKPIYVKEVKAALVHWRDHGFICGCSHGL